MDAGGILMKLGCWWRNGRPSTVRLIVMMRDIEEDVKR